VVAPGDDVLLAGLLRPPADLRHPVLQGPSAQLLRFPAFDERLDMLGLKALSGHLPEPHLVELVRDQGKDSFPRHLGGVATVAVAPAELFQFVIQVSHSLLSAIRFVSIACAWCLICSVSVSVRLDAWAYESYKGRGTPLPLCAGFLLLAAAAPALGIDGSPCWEQDSSRRAVDPWLGVAPYRRACP